MKHIIYLFFGFSSAFMAAQNPLYPPEVSTKDGWASQVPWMEIKVIRGLLFVKAEVDQEEGYFLLDTGSPYLILNAPPQSDGLVQARGLSSPLATHISSVLRLRIGEHEVRKIQAINMDLTHFEQIFKISIKGIIGYDILKKFRLQLDLKAFKFRLVPLRFKLKDFPSENFYQSIPFEQDMHLPLLSVTINGSSYRLGLDTGTSINYLDSENLALANTAWSAIYVRGLDQHEVEGKLSTISLVQVGEAEFHNLKFVFMNFSNVSQHTELQIDGLLGNRFLWGKEIIIDYQKNQLYLQ